MRSLRPVLAALISASALMCGVASAQMPPPGDRHGPPPGFGPPQMPEGIHARFVPLSMGEPGVLYEPDVPGPHTSVAFFVMHASNDYLQFSACFELAKRGYRVLCANNTTSKSGAFDDGILDDVITQAGNGVAWLRHQPGIAKVILFGHSGGATGRSAYQAIAEQGVAFCQKTTLIHRCSDRLAGLPKADGVVLVDSNFGQAAMTLFSIDAAVRDTGPSEDGAHTVDASLDSLNPVNGYHNGRAHFTAEFVNRYLAAQAARSRRLIARAQERVKAMAAGTANFTDDEPFIVPGAFVAANKLFPLDTALLEHSVKPWPLLHKGGVVTTEVIHSVRVATTGPMGPQTADRYASALKTTVKGFLSSYAIRTLPGYGYGADSAIHGVDWHSTYAAPPGNVEAITVPFLTLGMTGSWEGLAAETIYDHSHSTDRSIAFVEGANHIYQPCRECEKTPGEFGDTVKTTYDAIDQWTAKPGRFLTAP